MTRRPPRLLLGVKQALFARALRPFLEPRFEVVGIAASSADLFETARRERPEVVLTDVGPGGFGGPRGLRELRALCPESRLVVITDCSDAAVVRELFVAGAAALLLDSSGTAELVFAVEEALAGRPYVTPGATRALLEVLPSGAATTTETTEPPEIGRRLRQLELARHGAALELTPREVEVAARVAEGLSNHEIGERLFVAEGTVRTHLRNIFEKLGIDSRLELALYALKEGWASLDDWSPCRSSVASRPARAGRGAGGRPALLSLRSSPGKPTL